jgi:hypothetical protein
VYCCFGASLKFSGLISSGLLDSAGTLFNFVAAI